MKYLDEEDRVYYYMTSDLGVNYFPICKNGTMSVIRMLGIKDTTWKVAIKPELRKMSEKRLLVTREPLSRFLSGYRFFTERKRFGKPFRSVNHFVDFFIGSRFPYDNHFMRQTELIGFDLSFFDFVFDVSRLDKMADLLGLESRWENKTKIDTDELSDSSYEILADYLKPDYDLFGPSHDERMNEALAEIDETSVPCFEEHSFYHVAGDYFHEKDVKKAMWYWEKGAGLGNEQCRENIKWMKKKG